MISLTPRFSRINHVVFVLGIVFLAKILAGMIFVGACSDDGEFSVVHPASTVTPSASTSSLGPPSESLNNLNAAHTTNFAATAQGFLVTNANNHGAGSLREAITNANATTGADTIVFNIPGPGVKIISLETPLPEITEEVVIDGTSQPGYAGEPLIELNGGALTGFQSGLVITAGNSTVRGLAIGRFQSGIVLRSCDNNVIQSNYIGVDTGTQPLPNGTGIQLSNSSNNVIGGTSAAARNVISGNLDGIVIGGAGNVVQGNFIGTNAAGTAAVGNHDRGVAILSPPAFTNNVIGGNSAGAGNLISGNGDGVFIEAPGNTIQGNLIGTDFTGTKKVPNGLGIRANVPNTLIGGLTPAARNVISGNLSIGVSVSGDGSKLQGNFIGTDITGTIGLGNNGNGVDSGTNVLIGGTTPEARNVIAGNGGQGNIVLSSNPFGPGAIVQGNYIGTDVTGTRALSGSTFAGITILSNNNLIGGLVPGAQNVISGNTNGIRISSFIPGPPQANIIQGNLIGLNALGTGPLPNTMFGITCDNCFNNIVGGPQNEAANKIAFNGESGVRVFTGTGNSVRGNSVFSNGGLGIDLNGDGVTANDPNDADAGANNLQNFPVLTSVTSTGSNTTIQGSLNSTPNTTFQIDFYTSAALDPSGNGEGAQFLGTTPATTDGNGNATINVSFPVALGTGRVVTATATDPAGNTSEFSAGDISTASGNLQFSVGSIQINEDLGLLTLTVLRKGGSTGSVSVDYVTIDGEATAGQDYTATSGTVTFNAGETSKNIQIPILDDAVTESLETFTVALHNASNLEALGVPRSVAVTLWDHSASPIITQGDSTSVVEGNTGTTTEALFTFALSFATGRLVTANYATSNLTAFGSASCSNPGTDYETVSGTISFQPGATSVTVPVKVCGDTSAEENELIRFRLSNPSNAIVFFSQALGMIIDDDELELLLEESGPAVNQAAVLDALLLLRDPFRVVGIPEWFSTSSDRNTRVMFFVRGLQLNPGESPSAVIVRLTASNQLFDVSAEDVRSVPNVDFTQIVIRLPDSLPAGIGMVTVRAHSRTSNAGVIRITP